jgi:hypothetical protein
MCLTVGKIMKADRVSLNESSLFVLNDGIHEWRNKVSQRHRDDGPAVIKPDGTQEWYIKGLRHRLDRPAVVGADGTEEWWVNGRKHRTDGPAVVYSDGSKSWWQDGLLHRDDGPAIVTAGMIPRWFAHGDIMSKSVYELTICDIFKKMVNSVDGNIEKVPFSQMESLVYAFNGWKLP